MNDHTLLSDSAAHTGTSSIGETNFTLLKYEMANRMGDSSAELVPTGGSGDREAARERAAAVLYERYAGFVAADSLTVEDQIKALASLVPLSLQIVEEARDTIERLNAEVETLRGVRPPTAAEGPPPL